MKLVQELSPRTVMTDWETKDVLADAKLMEVHKPENPQYSDTEILQKELLTFS